MMTDRNRHLEFWNSCPHAEAVEISVPRDVASTGHRMIDATKGLDPVAKTCGVIESVHRHVRDTQKMLGLED